MDDTDDGPTRDAATDAAPHSTDTGVLAGHPRHTVADVRETYREQAETMDRMQWLDRLLLGRYRGRLFGDASGRVLDVACGLGTNARYLPDDCSYVGIDASRAMLEPAGQRLADRSRKTTVAEMDAQALALRADSFDTVISSLSTCTFPDPVAALAEMGRVCVPDGRILLLEHGRSSVGPVARFQDWRADSHFRKHSCRWNQDPLGLVEQSPLAIVDASSAVMGILTAIEARPS